MFNTIKTIRNHERQQYANFIDWVYEQKPFHGIAPRASAYAQLKAKFGFTKGKYRQILLKAILLRHFCLRKFTIVLTGKALFKYPELLA